MKTVIVLAAAVLGIGILIATALASAATEVVAEP